MMLLFFFQITRLCSKSTAGIISEVWTAVQHVKELILEYSHTEVDAAARRNHAAYRMVSLSTTYFVK